ncbi:hypothetical protein [Arcticibacter sp. MXS-1]|uniref:hypothetical protein n=1 Tax=Arcticibacter sp. MXS-1 TaxID=3341726 RepID=UPI0035A85606
MSERCLYCYQELNGAEKDFHARCSKKIFGQAIPPDLPYSEDQMSDLAEDIIKSHVAVTGVQPKLSVGIEKIRTRMHRIELPLLAYLEITF